MTRCGSDNSHFFNFFVKFFLTDSLCFVWPRKAPSKITAAAVFFSVPSIACHVIRYLSNGWFELVWSIYRVQWIECQIAVGGNEKKELQTKMHLKCTKWFNGKRRDDVRRWKGEGHWTLFENRNEILMYKVTHIQCSHSPSGPSSKIHCRFFFLIRPLFTFSHSFYGCCMLCIRFSSFTTSFSGIDYTNCLHFAVVHYVQFHCFPIYIFFKTSTLAYSTLTLYPFLLCTRNKESSNNNIKKSKKRLYFFRAHTPWCICVFFQWTCIICYDKMIFFCSLFFCMQTDILFAGVDFFGGGK